MKLLQTNLVLAALFFGVFFLMLFSVHFSKLHFCPMLEKR